MLTIQVCVGSSCFLRGSKNIVSEIKKLIGQHHLDTKVILKGIFCHQQCTNGVTVMIGEKLFTGVCVEGVQNLFENEILPAIKGN